MSSVRNAYDDRLCETYFAILERDLLHRLRFATWVENRQAIVSISIHGTQSAAGRSGETVAVEGKPVVQAVVQEHAHGKARAEARIASARQSSTSVKRTRYWSKVLSPPDHQEDPERTGQGSHRVLGHRRSLVEGARRSCTHRQRLVATSTPANAARAAMSGSASRR